MLLSSNNALEEDIEELRVIDYNCKVKCSVKTRNSLVDL